MPHQAYLLSHVCAAADANADDSREFLGPGTYSPDGKTHLQRRMGDLGIPDMRRMVARSLALAEAGEAGDLDAGVYAPDFTLVGGAGYGRGGSPVCGRRRTGRLCMEALWKVWSGWKTVPKWKSSRLN